MKPTIAEKLLMLGLALNAVAAFADFLPYGWDAKINAGCLALWAIIKTILKWQGKTPGVQDVDALREELQGKTGIVLSRRATKP